MSRRAGAAHGRLALLAATIAVAVVTGGAAAGDAPRGQWLPPIVGFTTYASFYPAVALGGNGVAVAVWYAGETGLTAATKLPGGSWEVVPLLSDAMPQSVAVDDAGNALVIARHWKGPYSNLVYELVAFTRAAGSREWRGPVAVSETDPTLGGGSVAANGRGQAVAVWIGHDGEDTVVRAALERADGSWSPAENLGYAGSSPSVAIDARGDAVVVWARGSNKAANVHAEYRPADAGWQPAVLLSSRADAWLHVRVVMNRRGDALALWGERDRSDKLSLVSSLLAAGATSWTEPSHVPISEPEEPLGALDGLSFALDEDGNATLVAQTHDGRVEAATRAADAAEWEGPVVLGDGGNLGSYNAYGYDIVCVEPRIGLDAAGGAVVIWGGEALYATRRPAGSRTWEKPVTVAAGPACFSRTLAVDSSGDAVAIWSPGKENVLHHDAAVLDVTPPVLEQLDVPASTRIRHRICFSVAASDVWSKLVGPPVWQFGDGAYTRGRVVRHVYRRPGRYLVSVTAEDLAGNAATSTASILVKGRR